jgi:hypothetical protein
LVVVLFLKIEIPSLKVDSGFQHLDLDQSTSNPFSMGQRLWIQFACQFNKLFSGFQNSQPSLNVRIPLGTSHVILELPPFSALASGSGTCIAV